MYKVLIAVLLCIGEICLHEGVNLNCIASSKAQRMASRDDIRRPCSRKAAYFSVHVIRSSDRHPLHIIYFE